MLKNDEFIMEIVDVTNEGSGVGKVEGMAVFVPLTAVGDIVKVKALKVKKTYAYGKLMEIITPSNKRIENDCPHFNRCGGCVFRHIAYDAELELKQNKVYEVIKRIGGVDLAPMPILFDESERYRNKAQYPLSENGGVGFYAFHSHRIIECEDCLLQPEIFSKICEVVSDFVRQYSISIYNEEKHKGLLRHLYIRRGQISGEIMVCFVINGDNLPKSEIIIEKLKEICGGELKSVTLNINKNDTNVILGDKCITLFGSDYITDILAGVKVRLSPLSFYQVNTVMAEKLYKKAAEYAKPDGKNIIDLYCGAGTIGLSMAKDAKSVIGVEIIEAAVKDAEFNAKENGINNARFICGDAKTAAEQLKNERIKPDTVIVDPPRKGCDSELIKIIANDFCPESVVYISCDPATLARDIKIFGEEGYNLVEYTPADLFPRTSHVETVVCLSREKADESEKESNMISAERSKYKSWSNLKKQMNNLLCDSLKDKITYFYTSYHEVNNAYGRATINCNKKELVAFSWDIGYAKWDDEYTVLNETNVNIQTLGSFQAVWDEQKRVQEELNKSKWMPEGKLCETDFINAVTTYLKTDIAAALHSDNYLLRVFAYMDRRVGKRTLVKIKDEVEKLPEWVKQFYRIRCEEDGIVFPPKGITDETVCLLSKIK